MANFSFLPARRIRYRGEVESRHDADDLLAKSGDAVLVHRGRPRSLVLACPDGCGSVLTVNLDHRSGKSWRLYQDPDGLSLYPSVWRDSGCHAHFILWRDCLLWCGRGLGSEEPSYDDTLEEDVLAALTDEPQTAAQIADRLSLIPWETNRIANRLVRTGQASATTSDPKLFFRKNIHPPSDKPREPKPKKQGLIARLLEALGLTV